MIHQYKITAFSDASGVRTEAAYQYADNPAQALAIYDSYTNAKDENGSAMYSLVTMAVCVYKTVSIGDFRKMYQA